MPYRTCIVVSVLALVLAGCGNPVDCLHPLSDAKTTGMDARLIGAWELEEEGKEDGFRPRIWVGRHREQPGVLEAVAVLLEKDEQVKVHRVAVHATKLGAHRYLSLGGNEDDGRDGAYLVVRYRLEDDGTLVAWGLAPSVVGRAIARETNEAKRALRLLAVQMFYRQHAAALELMGIPVPSQM